MKYLKVSTSELILLETLLITKKLSNQKYMTLETKSLLDKVKRALKQIEQAKKE